MSVQEYKQRLHEVIDGANDEAALRELLDRANRLLNSRDILDDLSEEQLARIDLSLEQIKQGHTVSSSQVREEAMQWLRKKIDWSVSAQTDFNEVIAYLADVWSPQIAERFIDDFYKN